MQKAWWNKGFSTVEALLASTVFAAIVSAIIGALVYGQVSVANAGDRTRALMLAEEGLEAVRNIRDAGYNNLTDGTYGLSQTGGVWATSGTTDTTGTFTRQTSIATNGANRKLITSQVSWPQINGTAQASVSTQLSNWAATLTKIWANAYQQSSLDTTGAIAGYRIATSGNYAYLVRNSATGPNFFVINITNPATPTVAGSLTLTGALTNVAVSGNYAYVTGNGDSAELQIVNVTTPTAPVRVGTYNAAGTGDGLGVEVIGTTAYLTRAANGGSDEFVIVNASTPSVPARVGGYNLSVSMYEAHVVGTTAYVATSSDTQEILVINMLVPGLLSLGTSVNLPGTTNATTIDGSNSTIIVGQGTIFHTATFLLNLAPVVGGSITLSGTINDVSIDETHAYGHVGTSDANAEFQVVNFTSLSSLGLLRTVNVTGSASVTGVAYNATKDVTPAATSLTNMEVAVFAPN